MLAKSEIVAPWPEDKDTSEQFSWVIQLITEDSHPPTLSKDTANKKGEKSRAGQQQNMKHKFYINCSIIFFNVNIEWKANQSWLSHPCN